MAITIKKVSPSKAIGKSAPKAKTTKPPKNKGTTRKLKPGEKVKGLEESLAQYHSKTDQELAQMIVPNEDRAGNATHKLDEEQREARLVLMHRMMIRKVGAKEIRDALGISVPLYYQLKDKLDSRMRLDVSKVDVPFLIGDSLAFYDEIRSMALTMSSSSAIKDPKVKVAAMTVALRAEDDKNKFLTACGVYSAPVVEHIVRGMVSTGNFNTVDGQSQKVIDAEEINMELAARLKSFAKSRAIDCTDSEIIPNE